MYDTIPLFLEGKKNVNSLKDTDTTLSLVNYYQSLCYKINIILLKCYISKRILFPNLILILQISFILLLL